MLPGVPRRHPGLSADPYKPEVIGHLDSNDSRMQQTYYANGKVWGSLDTRMTVAGNEQAGVAWFAVKPDMIGGGGGGKVGPQSAVVNQGYIGVANANVTYPALAVTTAGQGAMAFTLVGPANYPSAADVLFCNSGPVGTIHSDGSGPRAPGRVQRVQVLLAVRAWSQRRGTASASALGRLRSSR